MCISQVYVHCAVSQMHLRTHVYDCMYFHSQGARVDMGSVCVNMHTWPLPVFLSTSPMAACMFRYLQHSRKCPFCFCSCCSPCLYGEKSLNVGNAVKRNWFQWNVPLPCRHIATTFMLHIIPWWNLVNFMVCYYNSRVDWDKQLLLTPCPKFPGRERSE